MPLVGTFFPPRHSIWVSLFESHDAWLVEMPILPPSEATRWVDFVNRRLTVISPHYNPSSNSDNRDQEARRQRRFPRRREQGWRRRTWGGGITKYWYKNVLSYIYSQKSVYCRGREMFVWIVSCEFESREGYIFFINNTSPSYMLAFPIVLPSIPNYTSYCFF